MSKRLTVAAVVAVVVALLCVWFGVREGDPTPTERASPVAADSPTAAQRRRGPASEGDAPTPDVVPAPALVRIRVLTRDGAPVPGARVRVLRDARFDVYDTASLRRGDLVNLTAPDMLATARTDDDGRATVARPSATAATVVAHCRAMAVVVNWARDGALDAPPRPRRRPAAPGAHMA